MVIIQLAGGLGNQMFQYALYLQLKDLGREVKIDDVSGFAEDSQRVPTLAPFGITYERPSRKELQKMLDSSMLPWHRVRRKLFGRHKKSYFEQGKLFIPEVLTWDDIYLEGYWQTEKYFQPVEKQVREAYDTDRLAAYLKRAGQYLQGIDNTCSVSVHVRRGDYLDAVNAAMFGGICTETYYDTCVNYIKENCPGAVFYVFSDDAAYVRAHFKGEEFHIVDWNREKESFYDMQLMSCCRHHICANSTFSFWGARLNGKLDKIMIRPSIHKNTQTCVPEEMKKLWAGWTLVTPVGTVI